uniref:Vacuolar protein sorting-associated protein 45 n=1 Tax=Amorphochlora amoebiformis TaxID=1561963 RepID=A0A7S0GVR4_9EUKA
MTMVSLVISQTEIISKQVFIVEPIDNKSGNSSSSSTVDRQMSHLKAVCLLRPCKASISALEGALRKPKFKEYHIFFTNFVTDAALRSIAAADDFELVKQLQEYYADYYAVNEDLWHANMGRSRSLYGKRSHWTSADHDVLQRITQAILAMMLSAKKRPVVRYQNASSLAQTVAKEVIRGMKEESQVFDFRDSSRPVLLILDRREDPITPLLMQWTYQAMVHELLTITNNRVDMRNCPNVKKDMAQVVMSITQDQFFRESYTFNYGDLGKAIKGLVNKYKEKKTSQKIDTIQDMQRFVEQYPELKTFQGNVSKHVGVMVEMNRRVKEEKLMAVSEVEQNLACDKSHGTAVQEVMRMLGDSKVSFKRKVCISALYHLRYERHRGNEMATIRSLLKDQAKTPTNQKLVRFVDEIIRYAGEKVRGGELYGSRGGFFSSLKSVFSGGLSEIENVYTRYKPILSSVLDTLLKGNLSVQDYPYMDQVGSSNVDNVFVFVIGGVTYSEAALVAAINKSSSGCRVILGGSCIHNSTSFINDVLGLFPDMKEVEIDIKAEG